MRNTVVLLLSCPDRKGIVATVANFLYQNNASIIHADEHLDSELNLFFLRVEWDLKGFNLNHQNFNKSFLKIAEEFLMDWKVVYSNQLPKIAICVSKEEHCLADLLYRYKNGEIQAEVSAVISNHEITRMLAQFYQIPFYYIPSNNKQKAEKEILKVLIKGNISLLVLARYMQILSQDFINSFGHPIVNIHHSFLPAFVGAKPYHQAYQRGVKIIGATSHYVTENLDQGPIIEQDIQRVSHRDSIADLIQKGKDIEKIVLSRAVKWHVENKILIFSNKTVVFD